MFASSVNTALTTLRYECECCVYSMCVCPTKGVYSLLLPYVSWRHYTIKVQSK